MCVHNSGYAKGRWIAEIIHRIQHFFIFKEKTLLLSGQSIVLIIIQDQKISYGDQVRMM